MKPRALVWILLWGLAITGLGLAAEKPVHMFILSGQSNMANLDPEKAFLPEAKALLPGATVVHLKIAVGGEPIRFWVREWDDIGRASGLTQHTEKGPVYYEQILEGCRKLQEQHQAFASVTFCWMQGEKDGKSGLAPAYGAALSQLIANLRRDLARPDLKVVIGRLSDHRPGEAMQAGWDAVRALHVQIAQGDRHGAWVDTDDLNNQTRKDRTRVDGLHYTEEGYAEFGRRLARQGVRLIRGEKPDPNGRPGPPSQTLP